MYKKNNITDVDLNSNFFIFISNIIKNKKLRLP